jgi:putative transcriptional regulator
MPDRDIGLEILEGIQDIKARKVDGKVIRSNHLKEPVTPQEIRSKLNLSQVAFACFMGVSLRTVRDWEQGCRKPSGPAKALLRIADQKPEVFTQIL